MAKKLADYQLILFDMDGTLYFQRPLQLHMGMKMLLSCFQKDGMKEIKIVLKFRKLREHWQETAEKNNKGVSIDNAQYQKTARLCGMEPKEIERIIQKWIYHKPLEIIGRYRDDTLASLISSLQEQGKKLAIYSDYPAEDKRDALGLPPLPCFYGGQKEIASMKPDPKGILAIMSHFHIQNPEDVLMIGDRQGKDGLAAKGADADALILKKHKWQRKKQYLSLLSK